MIKDYLYTIGIYLPPSQRDDVLKKIESSLYDYLEEIYGIKEYYSDKEMEDAILKMGNPKEVALKYSDRPKALIGMPLLDTYFLILRIVIPATALGLIIAKIISFEESTSIVKIFISITSEIWSVSMSIIGTMTLIFGLIYWYAPHKDLIDNKEWSIRDLKKSPGSKDKVVLSDLIFEVIFSVVAFILFNGQSIFIRYTNILPIINETIITKYIFFINVVLILTIVLNIYLLIVRKWSNILRLISIGLDMVGIFVFCIIAFDKNLFDFSVISGISPSEVANMNVGFKISFLAIIIVLGFDIYKQIKTMIKQ